jgi:HlyD family secretion protein
MSKKIILPILIILAIGGYFGYTRYADTHRPPTDRLSLSGNIEVTEAEISFKIPGRVERRFVDEGDSVKLGQPIAELDSLELRDQAAVYRAQVAAAQQNLAELEHGSRPEEIRQGEANLAMTKADELRLRVDRQRYTALHDKDLVSTQLYEAAVTAHEVALAKVKDAEQRLDLLKQGPRTEKVAQARAQLDAAREQLAMSQTRLGYVNISSPVTGTVLAKNTEPGEYVSAGTPIVTVAALDNVWLRAYVGETDLGKVKLGQRACVFTDTFPGKAYDGRVSFISSQAEFTPKTVQTPKERVKLVYRIKIDIANPNQELKPGMPADAEIRLNGDQPCQPSASKS